MSFSKTLYPLLSVGSTEEDLKTSRHDGKIVDWTVKLQHKQTKQVCFSHSHRQKLNYVEVGLDTAMLNKIYTMYLSNYMYSKSYKVCISINNVQYLNYKEID